MSVEPRKPIEAVLTRRGTLPADDALSIVLEVARRVHLLHLEAGRVHGWLLPRFIAWDGRNEVQLLEAGPTFPAEDGTFDDELLPPELREHVAKSYPVQWSALCQRLEDEQIAMAAGRVNVYQLGALLCRLITSQPPSWYLRSPQVKASVPPPRYGR